MPTQEQVRRRVAEFEHQYPEALPDRLRWWARALGIDHARLFRLLGLSAPEATRTSWADLPRTVGERGDRAELVDEMLGQLLASFDYDLEALREALHRPVGPTSRAEERIDRRPDVVVPLPYSPRSQARRGILLNEIVAGGPSALPALLAYLSERRADEGRRGRRRD